MKVSSLMVVVLLATAGYVGSAAADPWKDESGHGRWIDRYEHDDHHWRKHRHERRAYKEEYRRGGCKIERKWDGGEYKKEVKCKRGWGPPVYGYRY